MKGISAEVTTRSPHRTMRGSSDSDRGPFTVPRITGVKRNVHRPLYLTASSTYDTTLPEPCRLPSLTGHVFMTVENDLCSKRGMASHLDGDVSPLRIHDVERIVIDEGSLGFQVLNHPGVGPLYVPHRGYRSAHQNQEQSANAGVLFEMFFGDQMFAFFTAAVDHRNTVGLRPAMHTATEASRHPHQVSIVQFRIRTVVQPSPPGTETTR